MMNSELQKINQVDPMVIELRIYTDSDALRKGLF